MPVVNLEFIFGNPTDSGKSGGIFPFIMSSIYVTLIAVLVATPLGVGLWFTFRICRREHLSKTYPFWIRNTGINTFYNIWPIRISVLCNLPRNGWSILSGGLTLALMALPTILSASEVSIESINKSYAEGSLALGATKWQTIYKVIIPAALPGITTGIILGVEELLQRLQQHYTQLVQL